MTDKATKPCDLCGKPPTLNGDTQEYPTVYLCGININLTHNIPKNLWFLRIRSPQSDITYPVTVCAGCGREL